MDKKRKYKELAKKERDKFNKDLVFIKYFLFIGCDSFEKKHHWDFEFYMLEKRINMYDMNQKETQDFKSKARREFKEISKQHKVKFDILAKKQKEWLKKSKSLSRVSPITLFTLKQIEIAKREGKNKPTVNEVRDIWIILSDNEKERYNEYYIKVLHEREILYDVGGLKNKKKFKLIEAHGVFRLYCENLNILNKAAGKISVYQAKEMWDELKEN